MSQLNFKNPKATKKNNIIIKNYDKKYFEIILIWNQKQERIIFRNIILPIIIE